jgi:hypothetical protein
MRKIVLCFSFFAAISMEAQTAQAVQTDTLQFMRDIRAFGCFADSAVLNKKIVDSLAIRQDTLIAHYRAIKPALTDKQVEEYNRIRGRYTRRIIEYRGDRVGEGLQVTGDSIAAKAGRVGKSIGGFFKGMFEK